MREFVIPLLSGGVATARGCHLSEALRNLSEASGGRLVALDFSGMDLSGLWLGSCRLEACHFDGATGDPEFCDVEFSRCFFPGADLTKASFIGCRFIACFMDEAKLVRARLFQTSFSSTSVERGDFRQARLDQVRFSDCRMHGMLFAQARFCKSLIEDCNLTGANFEQALFESDPREGATTFQRNDLRESVWRGASIILSHGSSENLADGADFRGAAMSCFEQPWRSRLGFVHRHTFVFGPRTRLPCAPVPWVLAYPRMAQWLGYGALCALGAGLTAVFLG